MKSCPYRIYTERYTITRKHIDSADSNSFAHQKFEKCEGEDCYFYDKTTNQCLRVNAELNVGLSTLNEYDE